MRSTAQSNTGYYLFSMHVTVWYFGFLYLLIVLLTKPVFVLNIGQQLTAACVMWLLVVWQWRSSWGVNVVIVFCAVFATRWSLQMAKITLKFATVSVEWVLRLVICVGLFLMTKPQCNWNQAAICGWTLLIGLLKLRDGLLWLNNS